MHKKVEKKCENVTVIHFKIWCSSPPMGTMTSLSYFRLTASTVSQAAFNLSNRYFLLVEVFIYKDALPFGIM